MSVFNKIDFSAPFSKALYSKPEKYYNPATKTGYSTNPFGIKLVEKTTGDPSKGYDLSTGDPAQNLINFSRLTDVNTLENLLEEEDHSRDMYVMSITKPVEFVKAKNDLIQKFQESATAFRKELLNLLIKFRISPAKANQTSSSAAKELYRILKHYLDTEIYPSKLEEQIFRAREGVVKKDLKGGVGRAQEKKIAGDELTK